MLIANGSLAATAIIAVASNFNEPAKKLAQLFEQQTPHSLKLVSAATGILTRQIASGAPYHALLAADSARPEWLEQQGYSISGSRYTYAIGKLVLAGKTIQPNSSALEHLTRLLSKQQRDNFIAIANPRTAPYGQASEACLKNLGILQRLKPQLVEANNSSQSLIFTSSGNTVVSFTALANVLAWQQHNRQTMSYVELRNCHPPLQQQALLLKQGKNNQAAIDFLRFIQQDQARQIILQSGYQLPLSL